MSTDKNYFILMKMRFHHFHLPVVMPLRCLSEVTEGINDVLSLFKFIDKRIPFAVTCVDSFINELRCYGSLDLIDIDVKNKRANFRMNIKLR